MAKKPTQKAEQLPILEQLSEVSTMTKVQLRKVVNDDEERPGIIRQYAEAILEGDIGDTLKIIKEVSKMGVPEIEPVEKSIEQLAIGDDDEAFYVALIQQNVAQLMRKNVSPQEVARLSQNINIFRSGLRDVRSRRPKKGSVLERVLAKADAPKAPTKANKASKAAKKSSKAAPKRADATKSKKTSSKSSTSKK